MNSGRVHPTPGIHLSKSNPSPHGKTQKQEVTGMLQISNSGKVVTIQRATWLVLTSTSGIKQRQENV